MPNTRFKPTWRSVGVHTVAELQRRHYKLDRRINSASFVLSCMRGGATLHLTYQHSGPAWALSDGRRVPDEVARLVTNDHRVVGVGDVLFQGMAAQTFRFHED
jgi:hypothetical protein